MCSFLAHDRLTRFGSESTDAFLQRVTHLHLQGKRINKLENMDSCINVKVLYLYDNHIERIENLNFAGNLQYLQLQNNMISEIPSLSMPSLTKLYLDDNRIRYLSGLEKCTSLEELHIANQVIPEQVSLQFDTSSLAAICRTLMTLEISGTGIEILAPFTVLRSLRRLFCSNNRVVKIDEIKAMVALRHLSEASFKGNPCCASLRYRDHAISASSDSLLLLDDVPVLRHQQIAIKVKFPFKNYPSAYFAPDEWSANIVKSENDSLLSPL